MKKKIKAEDSHGGREGGAEESVTELEAAIISEEKVEDVKNEPIVKEVKREEDVNTSDPLTGDAMQKEENSKVDAESLLAGSKEEADSSEKEVKNQVDVIDVPEPPKESTEALLEDSKATMVQESESETTKELAVPQAAVEEMNTTEELPEVPSEPVTEGKKEPEVVLPSAEPVIEEGNTESPKEEIPVTDTVRIEEVSEDVLEAIVSETKEFKEDAEVAAVTEEVHNVPETAEGNQNAVVNAEESVSFDSDPIVENVSVPVKPEDKFEGEMQEKAVVSEEPTMSIATNNDDATQVTEISAGSGGAENVQEVREATLEVFVMQEKAVVAEEPTLSDTANVDAPTQVSVVSSDGSGGVEKIENKESSLEGLIIQEKAVVAEEPTIRHAIESEPTTQVTEVSFKCFDGAEKVEEKKTTLEGLFMQEKAVVAEELTMSDTTESEAATQIPEVSSDEKKEAILEGLLTQLSLKLLPKFLKFARHWFLVHLIRNEWKL